MHEQMYGSAVRRQGGESVRACLPFPLLLLNMPKHRGKPAQPPFWLYAQKRSHLLTFWFSQVLSECVKIHRGDTKRHLTKTKKEENGDANVCNGGRKRLHPRLHIFASGKTYIQGAQKRCSPEHTFMASTRKKTSRKAQKLHTYAFLCIFSQRIPNDFLHKRDDLCIAILYFEQERRIFQTIIL